MAKYFNYVRITMIMIIMLENNDMEIKKEGVRR